MSDFLWMPHRPDTWPFRIVTLMRDVPFSKWNGHNAPATTGIWPAGTTVKIVMVSRFGDFGITDNVNAEHGYHARVEPEALFPSPILEE